MVCDLAKQYFSLQSLISFPLLNEAPLCKHISLTASNVLLFCCEGDADEELYQKLLNQ